MCDVLICDDSLRQSLFLLMICFNDYILEKSQKALPHILKLEKKDARLYVLDLKI